MAPAGAEPPHDAALAALVRSWRERALLTQEQLAGLTGLGVRTIRRLESAGLRHPRYQSVRLLADALRLTAAERSQLIATARAGPAPHPPAPVRIPRQLPADLAGFTGRAEQLRQLDALLAGDNGPPGTVVISAIAGTAGVGKTALAVHWAHRVAGRFPDGQLYLNLRGYGPGDAPVDPGAALRGFLEALGVPRRQLPSDADAQSALYRSTLADRRVLVVLDNARDAGQVRPLVPGAPGCLALVTSRDQLTGLVVTEAARLLTLDLMSMVEAQALFARRVGAERVYAEPAAAGRIVSLCARLPLALAVAAAHVSTRPDRQLTALADELHAAGGRLDTFDVGDILVSVRQVFSWSYQRLSTPAASLFRKLGLHPGPDLSLAAAASLAGRPATDTRPVLTELARAHLVTEPDPGRFSFHDLLRAYAAELAQSVDPEPARRATLHRMVDHYLHSSLAAAALLDPQRELNPPDQAPVATTPEWPGDCNQALVWFNTEHPVLSACVRVAADAGLHALAWHLAWLLPPFLDRRGYWNDWATTQASALAAAERLADLPKQARSHRSLGGAYTQLGHWDQAGDHLRRALTMYRALHDRAGQAHTHLDIDWLHDRQGSSRAALAHAEKALHLFRATDHRSGEARALNNVGWHHMQLGAFAQGLDYCRRALDSYRECRSVWGEANAWDSLGYAHHHLGEHGEAIDCYRNAVRLSRDAGDRSNEAQALAHLGDTYHSVGELASAHGAWRAALDVLEALSHPDAAGVQAKLRSTQPQLSELG